MAWPTSFTGWATYGSDRSASGGSRGAARALLVLLYPYHGRSGTRLRQQGVNPNKPYEKLMCDARDVSKSKRTGYSNTVRHYGFIETHSHRAMPPSHMALPRTYPNHGACMLGSSPPSSPLTRRSACDCRVLQGGLQLTHMMAFRRLSQQQARQVLSLTAPDLLTLMRFHQRRPD